MATSRLWIACRRTLKISAFGVTLIVVLIASYCGVIHYMGNINVVEQGQLYRSGQLDKAQFQRIIKQDGIKSILNLRGDNHTQPWYQDEIAVSQALDVKHFDYGIGASKFVTSKQIDEILAIVRDAPKPLLIHCQGGADRSGLVAALYVAEIEGRPPEEADEQLSLRYGHFPYLTSKTGAMDESFWAYVKKNSASRQIQTRPPSTRDVTPAASIEK